jgi:hypothetical protein
MRDFRLLRILRMLTLSILMSKVYIRTLLDLVLFVKHHKPSPNLCANIIQYRFKVWPIVHQFTSSTEMTKALLNLIKKHQGTELPLFLTNPNKPHAHKKQEDFIKSK